MERIKTNIIELDKLYVKPCGDWPQKFVDGKLDAHVAFKKYGQDYAWLYENSPYDLIGWEIENDCFDWEKYSHYVAKYCPEHLDAEKFDWKRYGYYIAKYCPDKLEVEKYNWKEHRWAICEYCPDKLPENKLINSYIEKETFFMVYLENQRTPTFKHTTLESAENEAKRLSKEFGKKAYVLCSLKSFEFCEYKVEDCRPEGEKLPF